jgi:phage/plasmid primase-like uncharacterized protein
MIAERIIEQARSIRIEDECTRRNIKLRGRNERYGPCPICGGDDRFSINLKKQVFYCRHCDVGGDVIQLVQHIDGGSFAEAVELLTGEQARPLACAPVTAKKQSIADYEREQHDKAAWLWSQRKPITGTIGERYLRARGITCPLPPTLAFLAPYKPEHHPAMIAAFGLCEEPEPGLIVPPRNVIAVHLTLLEPDGSGKANIEKKKIVIGSPGARPIVVAPPNDLLSLAITEGIEDGLSVYQATGIGVWVARAAGSLPALADVMPSYIRCVTIYAHDDDNSQHAGQRKACELADALLRKSIDVFMEGLPS